MKIIHTTFLTLFGWCGLIKGESGLLKIFLPEPEKSSIDHKIKLYFPLSMTSSVAFLKEIEEFEKYFAGEKPLFSFELDFLGSTLFQRMVWSETYKIPYGSVRTYGCIAEMIGKPKTARAVGNALGRNPFPIVVPCHRVIKKNGELGGFSAPMGINLKAKLLKLEGLHFS